MWSQLNDYLLLMIINTYTCIVNSDSLNYIQYNLHDYCTDKTWSDFPGRHMISAEKSLLIRNPLIVNFNHNNNTKFVSYCLIRLYANEDKRIYATGSSTGISTNGKQWFTESLHFTPTSSKILSMNKVKEVFETTTHNNALELVFEQLEKQQFTFQLVITPFREIGYESECEDQSEYKCSNNRCIASYLICDNHNNCGDSSDESVNCLVNLVPIETIDPLITSTTVSTTTLKPITTTLTIADNSSLILNTTLLSSKDFEFLNIIIYVLIVLVIIIFVTFINFLIWCLVTKKDQSFLVIRTPSSSSV